MRLLWALSYTGSHKFGTLLKVVGDVQGLLMIQGHFPR